MNIKNYDVIIAGGGASGLFCGYLIKAQKPHLSVAVLEKQKSVGKKLLATGNGRCNLTNLNAHKDMYHGSFKDGAAKLLEAFSPAMLIKEFKNMGLLTTIDSEGRVYPASKHSASVLDVLTLNCESKHVDIITDSFIKSIVPFANGYTITTDSKIYNANTVVIASGSKANPETGADDSLLTNLKNTGHTITPLYPALCPVYVKSKSLFALKGVRVNGTAAIYKNNKLIKSESGEIQFTDKTLSGICLFNLSRIANTTDNTVIVLSLLPQMIKAEIKDSIIKSINRLPENTAVENIFCGIFQRKLSIALLKDAGINKERTAYSLTEKEINTIAELINNWKFPVIPSSDFKRAQIVAGGIHGNEINKYTMESKINKNMYIIGEAVDCDGDCGGLNLQFAFASAYIAAKSITL